MPVAANPPKRGLFSLGLRDKAEHAGDTKALLALVEKAAHTQGCQIPGAVKLRVTLGSTGKITASSWSQATASSAKRLLAS